MTPAMFPDFASWSAWLIGGLLNWLAASVAIGLALGLLREGMS